MTASTASHSGAGDAIVVDVVEVVLDDVDVVVELVVLVDDVFGAAVDVVDQTVVDGAMLVDVAGAVVEVVVVDELPSHDTSTSDAITASVARLTTRA